MVFNNFNDYVFQNFKEKYGFAYKDNEELVNYYESGDLRLSLDYAIELFEGFQKQSTKLPSRHQIGDEVFFEVAGRKIEATVHSVTILKEKIKYNLNLLLDYNDALRYATRIYNVDSNFVLKRGEEVGM